jgi:hypothetical protein
MPTLAVVKYLDIVEDIRPGRFPGWIDMPANALPLE